jgi:hypothetical protein
MRKGQPIVSVINITMKVSELYIAVAIVSLISSSPIFAQENAAALYAQAAKLILVSCPAASNLEYPAYPPFGPDWDRLEQDAWAKNAPARLLARQATLSSRANWTIAAENLNACRALANELGDAALYEHLHGDDAAACQTIEDILHLTTLLREPRTDKKPATLIQFLVAGGIDALAAYRLMIIDSQIRLTNDPANKVDLQLSAAHTLIVELLNQEDPKNETGEFSNADGTPKALPNAKITLATVTETFNRSNGERTFAAMSLACHIFLFQKHHWPDSLDELAPAYMPKIPIDPWGDGKQTFGYTLIEPGLPDGSDRPLIYSRGASNSSLYYRTDQPQYGYYINGSTRTKSPGGQFRDVASWIPQTPPNNVPTTRPLD